MSKLDDLMFGVKLIYPEHLRYPYFTEHFDGSDGRYTLMNFRGDSRGRTAAERIPTGHRALVFTKGHLIWAIEFIGPLDTEGKLAAVHSLPHDDRNKWPVHRPIRFLAKMDVNVDNYFSAPTRREIEERSGVTKRSYGQGHFYVTRAEYEAMYRSVKWDWEAPDVAASLPAFDSGTPRTLGDSNGNAHASVAITECPVNAALPIATAPRVSYDTPPIEDAAYILCRIREVAGQPERNMEDVVKELLMRLGHPSSAIVFQQGRVDVRLNRPGGGTQAVFEVKRSISADRIREGALRQAHHYAAQVGARLMVVTDCDTYVIFDRTRGLDLTSMLCGEFALTRYRCETDDDILNLLRPARRD